VQSARNDISLRFAVSERDPENFISFLHSNNLEYYQGDHFNVLQRYLDCSVDLDDSDFVVRLTGDNPFVDQEAMIKVIDHIVQNRDIDLVYPVSLPLGMGFEVVRVGALRSQTVNSLHLHHEEHVTTFIKENREVYRVVPVEIETRRCDLRLTIDYPEDLLMAEKTYGYFSAAGNPDFISSDVISLYEKQQDFFASNKEMEQKSSRSFEKRD